MPTLNIKHGKIKKKKMAKYILGMYNNYNTSDVKSRGNYSKVR